MPKPIEAHHARQEVIEGMVADALDAFTEWEPNVADILSASMTLSVRAINVVLEACEHNPVAYELNRSMIEEAVLKMWERCKLKGVVQ